MPKASNPNVPLSAAEIADDAALCRAAGAAIVHAHARNADGTLDNTVAGYLETLRGVRDRTDVLLAPPLLNTPGAEDDARLAVLAAADGAGFSAADFVVVEMGTTNFDLVDVDRHDFVSTQRVFSTTTESQLRFIEEARRRGLPVLATSFGAAWTRAVAVHRSAGRLNGRLLTLLVHGGPEFVAAHPATAAGLEAHRALLAPDPQVEWMVSAHRANVLDLAEEAIASGGHVAVGLGDYAHPERGFPTNAELVAEVAEIGRRHGRSPATPEEVRQWFSPRSEENRA